MAFLKALAEQGNVDAEYMRGCLMLDSHRFVKLGMKPAREEGIVCLKSLGIQKRHVPSLMMLAEYYLEQIKTAQVSKQKALYAKKAEEYLLKILEINNQHSAALLSLAEIYHHNPKLNPPLEIRALLDKAGMNGDKIIKHA